MKSSKVAVHLNDIEKIDAVLYPLLTISATRSSAMPKLRHIEEKLDGERDGCIASRSEPGGMSLMDDSSAGPA